MYDVYRRLLAVSRSYQLPVSANRSVDQIFLRRTGIVGALRFGARRATLIEGVHRWAGYFGG